MKKLHELPVQTLRNALQAFVAAEAVNNVKPVDTVLDYLEISHDIYNQGLEILKRGGWDEIIEDEDWLEIRIRQLLGEY